MNSDSSALLPKRTTVDVPPISSCIGSRLRARAEVAKAKECRW